MRLLAGAILLVGLVGTIGWLATDALERRNDFCNACHAAAGGPLHLDHRRDLDARPAQSLASRHAVVLPEWRPEDPVMRCFDCHSGVGPFGRAHIKWIAARDLVIWLAGRAEEPSGLDVPLRDADCQKCHHTFVSASEDRGRPPFHSLAVHDRALGIDCTTCHPVHDDDVDPGFHYLATARVKDQCARCHRPFDG